MRSRLLLLAATLAGALIAAPMAARAQAELRIATEGAYPPFNYVDGNDPAGFEVDLGRALCAAMGLPCAFVIQDWDGMFAGLREKRYDAVMSSIEITPKRRQRYEFSKPYYQIPGTLIGSKDSELRGKPYDPAGLAGRTVGVVMDSEFETYLRNVAKGAEIRLYHRLDEATLDLLTGRIDYVMGDKLDIWRFLTSREGTTCCRWIADPPVERDPGYGVVLRRGDKALAEMFDQALDQVVASGEYDRIRAKYVPFDIKVAPLGKSGRDTK